MVGTKRKCERVSTSNSAKGKGMRGHKGGKALTKGIEKRDWDEKEKDQKQKRRKG